MKIIQAESKHLNQVRELFREFQDEIDTNCCFEGFEEEFANLPGQYASPKGAILIVTDDQQAVACVAIKPKPSTNQTLETEAELKRLYIKPNYRGQGWGRELFDASLNATQKMGYKSVYLETVPDKMAAAYDLYLDAGFQPVTSRVTGKNDSQKDTDQDIQCLRYVFDNIRTANY